MACPNCGTANAAGAKFCMECGTHLATGCPNCGASNQPGARFCNECGTRLVAEGAVAGTAAGSIANAVSARGPLAAGQTAPTAPPASPSPRPAAATERRHVSVLFADLVGFTTLAADRDPEAVRDLLTRYFDVAREIVERYGGTVEKFIGDAVMAVWGTPVAQEDDAERAVRTALDLIEAVRDLDAGADGRGLEARAGVLTGEAAVTIGATGQGMVAGDLVNSASRLQAVAPPGTVLVGESTYRASSRAIAFVEAGDQVLRGKKAPVPAWQALRVVAKRGGQGRAEGLEAPFVGREDELRLLKDFFHATSRERRARLVSVTGQAGIGKSRLGWEFLKYLDGVLETVYWHSGRSPAYGEGITFWALGEMVRRRAGLAEGDDEATTREGIRASLVEFVPDETERRWIEPALVFLLGYGEAPAGGREELFAAWRTFFERIATRASGAPRLRGPPVGRRGPARLHRSPPGVVDEPPHLRRHAGPPGAPRAPARLGRRASQLRGAVVAAAVRVVDARPAGRARPGPAGPGRAGDPRPGRRDPALRGRDRPNARRRGAPRARRRHLSADVGPDRAGRPGLAPRPDRGPPGRPRPGRPRSPPGRVGPRPDVPGRRPGDAERRDGRGARAAAPVAGAARDPGPRHRPEVAGARPVRVHPGADPRGRVLDAVEAGAPRTTPGGRPLLRVARRRRGDRRPGDPLHRCLRRLARGTGGRDRGRPGPDRPSGCRVAGVGAWLARAGGRLSQASAGGDSGSGRGLRAPGADRRRADPVRPNSRCHRPAPLRGRRRSRRGAIEPASCGQASCWPMA